MTRVDNFPRDSASENRRRNRSRSSSASSQRHARLSQTPPHHNARPHAGTQQAGGVPAIGALHLDNAGAHIRQQAAAERAASAMPASTTRTPAGGRGVLPTSRRRASATTSRHGQHRVVHHHPPVTDGAVARVGLTHRSIIPAKYSIFLGGREHSAATATWLGWISTAPL